MKKIKIIIIFAEPTKYILDLIDVLKDINYIEFDVYFLYKYKTQKWKLNTKLNFLPNNFLHFNAFFLNLIMKNKYDIVHLCGWGNIRLLSLMLISFIFKTTITIESDTPLNSSNISYFKKFKRLFYKIFLPLPKLFFPAGKSQRKHLIKYGVKCKKIKEVNMTVKIKDFIKFKEHFAEKNKIKTRKKFKIAANSILFLFVGRLIKEKGLELFIKSFKKASEINNNIHLLIVGGGPLYNDLKNLIQDFSNISLAGALYDNDLLETYSSADIFVLPSISETWGLVINEAMASSLPLLVNKNVGCIDDLVFDKENGIIFDFKNQKYLIKSILFLANNEDLRNKMALNSKKIISTWTLRNQALKLSEGWRRVKK